MNKLTEMAVRTDSTFSKAGDRWVGRCLICNGKLSLDERTGVGANLEHIVPRAIGGTNDPLNLGITHPTCNSEKGRNWDPRKKHRVRAEEYMRLQQRLLERRRERWRDPGNTQH